VHALDPVFSNLLSSMMPVVIILTLLSLLGLALVAGFGGPREILKRSIEREALDRMMREESRADAERTDSIG